MPFERALDFVGTTILWEILAVQLLLGRLYVVYVFLFCKTKDCDSLREIIAGLFQDTSVRMTSRVISMGTVEVSNLTVSSTFEGGMQEKSTEEVGQAGAGSNSPPSTV